MVKLSKVQMMALKTNAKAGKTRVKAVNEAKTNKKWGDLPICHNCNATIDDEVKALQCESCEEVWSCTKCLEISDELYVLLPEAPLHWYCSACEKKRLARARKAMLKCCSYWKG